MCANKNAEKREMGNTRMNNSNSLSITSDIYKSNNYYIIFELRSRKYAVNIQNVVEVINLPAIEIPESTPEGIIGLLNYNGRMIKTVDLCPFLGFETSQFTINNRLIIAKVKEEYFAIHTENIETITKFEEENFQNVPFSVKDSLLKQIYKSEKGNVNIINSEILYDLISQKNNQRSKINYLNLFPSDSKSLQILNLRAHSTELAQEAFAFPTNSQSVKQYILFIIDNQNYFMDIKYVKEFISLKRLHITKLPYTGDYIAGIVNVKGEFLVVCDLKRFLNNGGTDSYKSKKLIVAEGRNFNIAFLVDDIKYIRNLKDIQKTKIYSSSSNYIYAEFMEDDELYSILNFEEIINDDRLYINIE